MSKKTREYYEQNQKLKKDIKNVIIYLERVLKKA